MPRSSAKARRQSGHAEFVKAVTKYKMDNPSVKHRDALRIVSDMRKNGNGNVIVNPITQEVTPSGVQKMIIQRRSELTHEIEVRQKELAEWDSVGVSHQK